MEYIDCFSSMSRLRPLQQVLDELSQRRRALTDEQVLDLVYDDFLTRKQAGQEPVAGAYVAALPELQDAITRLFEVESALAEGELPSQTLSDLDEHVDSPDGRIGQVLGGFRIVREINRGAMGIVYEAENPDGARVALKVLHRLAAADPTRRKRFVNEIHAASTLEIEGIVPVLVDGVDQGAVYFAMPLLVGPNLEEFLLDVRRALGATASLPPGSVAASVANVSPVAAAWGTDEYFITTALKLAELAEAVHASHEVGVIHRDIKPSNLLFDESGRLWLTDFGLAHLGEEETFTRTGDVLGTYHYMSPEQALGNKSRVDSRSDVYSLGATLYEFASLHRPFHDLTMPRLLRAIAHESPNSLRRCTNAPASMRAVVAKAMEKSPDDRYATTLEFAKDLRRFAAGQVTEAERISRSRRVTRWLLRRQRTLAAMLLIGAVALISGYVGLQMRASHLRAIERRLSEQKRQIDEARYASMVRSAFDALSSGDAATAAEIVSEWTDSDASHPAGLEWRQLKHLARPLSPEQVIDAGQGEVHAIALFPDGRRLASVGEKGTLVVWDLDNGAPLIRKTASLEPLLTVATSPDGRKVAVAGKESKVLVFDLTNDAVTHEFGPFRHSVESLVFSPSGRRLAIGIVYDPIEIHDLTSGEAFVLESQARNESIRFSPDGSRLLGAAKPPAGESDLLHLWALDSSGPPQRRLRIEGRTPSQPRYFEFSSDGAWAFVVDRRSAIASYFSMESGDLILEVAAVGEREAFAAAMAADDRWCAVGLASGNVRYWEVLQPAGLDRPAQENEGSYSAHRGKVLDMAFRPTGELITAGEDGLIKRWPPFRAGLSHVHRPGLMFQSLGGDVDSVVAARHVDATQVASRFNLRNRTWRDFPLGEHQTGFNCSIDRRWMCAFGANGSVAVLDADTGEVVASARQGEKSVTAAAFAPDGSEVAVGDQTGLLTLRTAADLSEKNSLDMGSSVRSLAFSPDKTLLACTDEAGCVHFIDASQWSVLRTIDVYSQSVISVWRPGTRQLYTGHFDGRVLVWDADLRESVAVLRDHRQTISGLSFSPDGRTLYSASADGTIRLWQAETGNSLGTLYRARSSEAELMKIVNLGSNGFAALQYSEGEASLLLWEWE